MKINVDLQLLLYLMGYDNPAIYSLWLMLLNNKTEEERTSLIENIIKMWLDGLIEEVERDV